MMKSSHTTAADQGRRLALQLLDQLKRLAKGSVLRYATVKAVSLSDGVWLMDIDLDGTIWSGVPMTMDCIGARAGDRCIVEIQDHLPTVTGVLARSSTRSEFVKSVQWKPPYSNDLIRLCRVGDMVCATGMVKFTASGEVNDAKHNEVVPSGYRPAFDNASIVSGARSTLCFFVKKSGAVYGRGNSNAAYTNLTGCWPTVDPLPS